MIDFAGRNGSLEIFGVNLVGVNAENARKVAMTAAVLIVVPLIGWGISKLIQLTGRITGRVNSRRAAFWTKQGTSLLVAILIVLMLISIWFDNPGRLATFLGLITAGIAIAMQRVITAIAGYFLILRGKVFNAGDRIVIGGVRGDVVDLSFLQTTVMEMGEAKGEQADSPSVWVHSRQYTGRIVTVSNAVIFDQPVYNYTREFPFIFEEIAVPIAYDSDWQKAEQIILAAAEKHTVTFSEMEKEAIEDLKRRYFLGDENPGPRVYWRLTDNWVEMSVRFVVPDHGVRGIKDAMSREIVQNLKAAGLGIASGTYQVVGMPKLQVALSADSSLKTPSSSPPAANPPQG
ncbi:MAG TPA: mechanosensitive ion channel family protein [Rhizomicrobium sp.]|nr:mechanosensitive ion channel family protein [Rhizomicrobium sp.]